MNLHMGGVVMTQGCIVRRIQIRLIEANT